MKIVVVGGSGRIGGKLVHRTTTRSSRPRRPSASTPSPGPAFSETSGRNLIAAGLAAPNHL